MTGYIRLIRPYRIEKRYFNVFDVIVQRDQQKSPFLCTRNVNESKINDN